METGEPLEDLSMDERDSAESGDWTGGKLVLMGVIHVGSRTWSARIANSSFSS